MHFILLKCKNACYHLYSLQQLEGGGSINKKQLLSKQPVQMLNLEVEDLEFCFSPSVIEFV